MANEVEKIKEKLDVKEVVGGYINLKPAGKNLKGLCPFHQEKDPSFIVSPHKGIWHCFGCGKGGDLIEFVKLYEGLEFPEALRLLADKAGIPMKDISRREQKHLTTLYEINAQAKDFFMRHLKNTEQAFKYLRNRGLTEATIEEFELGYAPGGDSLTQYLLQEGFNLEDIQKAGLSYKSRGLNKDRFRKRIMFPIVNEIDRVVAFTGRIAPKLEDEDDIPKYLNSPETPVYNKSKVLYGLYKTKPEIVNSKTVFLVEGQMDFLMVWQAGVENAVAVSGTGLTRQHLDKLSRLADSVILSFDNDSGGLRALERSIDVFSQFDFHVKAMDLGEFSDPADAVQADPEKFRESIDEARPVFIQLFEHYFGDESDDMVEKKKSVRHLLNKISQLDSAVEQDMWVEKLSEYCKISEPSLHRELDELRKNPGKKSNKGEKTDEMEDMTPKERVDTVARRLLILGFAKDEFLEIIEENKDILPDQYKNIVEDKEGEIAGRLQMKASAEVSGREDDEVIEEIKELIRHLKIEYLKGKQKIIKQKMRKTDDDEEALNSLADRFHKVAKKLEEIKRQ